jgi:hypothetical protein
MSRNDSRPMGRARTTPPVVHPEDLVDPFQVVGSPAVQTQSDLHLRQAFWAAKANMTRSEIEEAAREDGLEITEKFEGGRSSLE